VERCLRGGAAESARRPVHAAWRAETPCPQTPALEHRRCFRCAENVRRRLRTFVTEPLAIRPSLFISGKRQSSTANICHGFSGNPTACRASVENVRAPAPPPTCVTRTQTRPGCRVVSVRPTCKRERPVSVTTRARMSSGKHPVPFVPARRLHNEFSKSKPRPAARLRGRERSFAAPRPALRGRSPTSHAI
jgi:hypothetical protein